MEARERILAIRLMERIQKNSDYAQSLGITADLKKTACMSHDLHAEGLTEL